MNGDVSLILLLILIVVFLFMTSGCAAIAKAAGYTADAIEVATGVEKPDNGTPTDWAEWLIRIALVLGYPLWLREKRKNGKLLSSI